jgi:aminoglycoside 6-adenylyltransferase
MRQAEWGNRSQGTSRGLQDFCLFCQGEARLAQVAAQGRPGDLAGTGCQDHDVFASPDTENNAAHDLLRFLAALAGSLLERLNGPRMAEQAVRDPEPFKLAGDVGRVLLLGEFTHSCGIVTRLDTIIKGRWKFNNPLPMERSTMRREQEMLDLILGTARDDERIRAVIMNGSRANPNAPGDIFQDFDIVYLVTDVTPFKEDRNWIKRFGELMILQMPEEMSDPPPKNDGTVVYLMQFTDGNRIDLGIVPTSMVEAVEQDSLSLLLLDKDGIVRNLAPASEASILPEPPNAKTFGDCCNEFWWLCPYVAKGLWREEIVYARHIMGFFMREQLNRMLTWHIGVNTGFQRNPGKFGRYFQQYLDPESWEMLMKTYTSARYEDTWEALFTMSKLFRKTAILVAEHFMYEYPFEDDRRVSAHLEHVRTLPKDVVEIY